MVQPGNQLAPAVAAGNSSFLVVFQDAKGLMGAFVPFAGPYTTPTPFRIMTTTTQVGAPAVAFNGTGSTGDFAVVFQQGTSPNTHIDLVHVPEGSTSGLAAPSFLADGAGDDFAPLITWHGSAFALVWANGGHLYRTTFTGTPTSPASTTSNQVPIATGGTDERSAAIATLGGGLWIVVFRETDSGGLSAKPALVRYSGATPTDGAAVTFGGSANPFTAMVAPEPTDYPGPSPRYLVLFSQSLYTQPVNAVLVGTSGAPSALASPLFTIQNAGFTQVPYFADGVNGTGANTRHLLVYQFDDSPPDVHAVTLNLWSGTNLGSLAANLTESAPSEDGPVATLNGTSGLVTWTMSFDAGTDVAWRGVRTDGGLGALTVDTQPGYQSGPRAIGGPNGFLVIWSDSRGGPSLMGQLVDLTGAPVGGEIAIDTGGLAGGFGGTFDGTNYVAYYATSANLAFRRVSPTGTVLDTTPRAASDAGVSGMTPAVASPGDGGPTLVASNRYYYDPSLIQYITELELQTFTAGNALASDVQVPMLPNAPVSAFDGTNFLLAWPDGIGTADAGVYGRRVSRAGAFVDAAPVPLVRGAPFFQYGLSTPVSLSFDGLSYVLAWAETSADAGVDVVARTYTPALRPLSTVRLASPLDERIASVSGSGGVSLVAFQRFEPAAPVQAEHVWAQTFTHAPGDACLTSADCGAGVCVGGLCCDRACTGTCEACTAAAKASGPDGVCGPVKAGAKTCRASAGVCDPAETCDGVNAACPADARSAATVVCRPADAGAPCDAPELCDGTSAACPADLPAAQGTVCRPAADGCDRAETCTGSSFACPTNGFLDAGVVCASTARACAVSGVCTGTSATCPATGVRPASFVCRPAAGSCDIAESCDGLSDLCPSDTLVASTTVCRPAAGNCDVAEHCAGTADCPADGFLDTSTTCRAATGPCDVAEHCSGTADCPADGFLDSSTTCRPSAGPCDVAEHCAGGASCPADAFAATDVVCREAAGLCDVAERCTGAAATCPQDLVAPADVVCRPAASACDAEERCDARAVTCPSDVAAPDGTSCGDLKACKAGACEVTTIDEGSPYALGCGGCTSSGVSVSFVGLLAWTLVRRRRGALGLSLAALVGSLVMPVRAEAAEKKPKLAMLGVRNGQGVTEAEAHTVSETIQAELASLGLYDVISYDDLASILGVERQKQLLGCGSDSESCTAELAGAINTERLVRGEVGLVGGVAVLSLTMIDGKASKPIARAAHRSDGGMSTLLSEIRPAVYDLVNQTPELAGHPLLLEKAGGFLLGVRADADLLGPAVAPSVMVAFSAARFGAALGIFPKTNPGVRLEGRFFPLLVGAVRLYLAAGATAFSSGVDARGALGLEAAFGHLVVLGDVAYERAVGSFKPPNEVFHQSAVLVSVGAGWLF